MKPHPRIRKTIKWGGAAVTLLLVVVWVSSAWWYGGLVTGDRHIVGVASGALNFRWCPDGRPPPVPRPGSFFGANEGEFEWLPRWDYHPPWPAQVVLPIWIPAACAALLAATAWRLDILVRRRARGGVNLCPKCNYDRAGLAVGAKCPECGSAPA